MKAISDFFSSHGIDPFLAGLVIGGFVFMVARAAMFGGRRSSPMRFHRGKESDARHPVISWTEGASIKVSAGGVERELTAEQSANVWAALRLGNKIEAIKIVRAAVGLGLKEAKDLVDMLSRG